MVFPSLDGTIICVSLVDMRVNSLESKIVLVKADLVSFKHLLSSICKAGAYLMV